MADSQLNFLEKLTSRIKADLQDELVFEETAIGKWTFYNISEVGRQESQLIRDTTYTGFSKDPIIAFSKAMSELIERNAFRLGYKVGLINCQTERSDGFAAFPNFPDLVNAKGLARDNAYSEALERFVWATWWDNKTTSQVTTLNKDIYDYFKDLFNVIDRHTPIEQIYVVEPTFETLASHPSKSRLIMIFLKIGGGGYISAGAVGASDDLISIFERAIAELIRHSVATYRWKELKLTPSTFYERRLCYFAEGSHNFLVEKHLFSQGNGIIKLPALSIDSIIPHQFEDLVTVYRCLFTDQPPFVGGALERFCL